MYPALVQLGQVGLEEPHFVEVLKARVDRGLRDPAPEPAQPFSQLREGKAVTALVIGEDGEDA